MDREPEKGTVVEKADGSRLAVTEVHGRQNPVDDTWTVSLSDGSRQDVFYWPLVERWVCMESIFDYKVESMRLQPE